MKKVKKLLSVVLCAVMLLAVAAVVKPTTAEASVYGIRYAKRYTVTNKSALPGYVIVRNTSSSKLYVSTEGGYAWGGGADYTIKGYSSKKICFGLLSPKGAVFYLYVSDPDCDIKTTRCSCK